MWQTLAVSPIKHQQWLDYPVLPSYSAPVDKAETAAKYKYGQGRALTGPLCFAAPLTNETPKDRRRQPLGPNKLKKEPETTWLKTHQWRNSKPS